MSRNSPLQTADEVEGGDRASTCGNSDVCELVAAGTLSIVPPALIAMCGLGFSGKSVLARSLNQELGIAVLCYETSAYMGTFMITELRLFDPGREHVRPSDHP